ncbi:MAG TPA: cobyrinate a,c-diamide synthase [Streptosporangiaceae bacterium]
MVAVPRLVIAAPASGSGKTTVACGLMAALRRKGLAVSGHKVGPDYIDPGYHALATGRPPRNLDPFLCGEDLIGPLFLHGAAGAEIAVVEGVMGMFDGVDPALGLAPDHGSTAHVARLLAAPVVLVIDAARAGRSVAALASGFARFDPRTPVAGVILNRVASDRHERLLRDALAAIDMPVYGAIRRTEGIVTPSRHLGLIPAAEREQAAGQAIRAMGDLITAHCDLTALLRLASRAPELTAPPWSPPEPPATRTPPPTIAAAAGAAFTFGYTEQAELLQAAGAQVAPFDPLNDEDLPAGTDGLILGGGFPEVHAAALAANERLRVQVAALAGRGAPVAAECAGLLYLARTLDGRPMCGVLDIEAAMTPKLTLGYRRAVAAADSVLAQAGDVVHGHEFHRTMATPEAGPHPAWTLTTGTREGHVAGNVVASYLHTHWAGHPSAAARFTAASAKARVP